MKNIVGSTQYFQAQPTALSLFPLKPDRVVGGHCHGKFLPLTAVSYGKTAESFSTKMRTRKVLLNGCQAQLCKINKTSSIFQRPFATDFEEIYRREQRKKKQKRRKRTTRQVNAPQNMNLLRVEFSSLLFLMAVTCVVPYFLYSIFFSSFFRCCWNALMRFYTWNMDSLLFCDFMSSNTPKMCTQI